MCVILDNSIVGILTSDRTHPCHALLHRWLLSGRGCLTIGGMLSRETMRNNRFCELLEDLNRAGRLKREKDAEVEAETRRVKSMPQLTSDDPHVIALARVSGARVLYSDDEALMDDFRNPDLVPKPLGKLYKSERNKNVLEKAAPCRKRMEAAENARMKRRRQ